MNKGLIKNFKELATNSNRKLALEIMEAGLDAINTKRVVNSAVSLKGDSLFVKEKEFNLAAFKRIKIVGFGKSSCEAASALEKILGSRISGGAIIGLSKIDSEYMEIFAGTHPKPSLANIDAGKKIYEIIKDSTEEDLIIALVSGGGSALLCYPEHECEQGTKLYDAFLKSDKTITEMNTIRKHLSLLKGGGLAKIAYPATIIGLIFSDIPGDHFENVASGPTYKDITTVEDAKKIIKEGNLGDFDLVETPKEDKYFDNVFNFVLVSDKTAVEAMMRKAQELDFRTNIISTDLYDEIEVAIKKIFSGQENNTVVLAAGEPRIRITRKGGKGGRSLHMALSAMGMGVVGENSVFMPFASDGMDNSDGAGAIVDEETIKKAKERNLEADSYLKAFNSYDFFQKTGDMIMTGSTGANVSDLMILLTKGNE